MSGLLRFKQAVKDAVSRLPGGEWLVRQRFAKFGAVGFAGTIVNVSVLYVTDKFVYRGIESRNPGEPGPRDGHLHRHGAQLSVEPGMDVGRP